MALASWKWGNVAHRIDVSTPVARLCHFAAWQRVLSHQVRAEWSLAILPCTGGNSGTVYHWVSLRVGSCGWACVVWAMATILVF